MGRVRVDRLSPRTRALLVGLAGAILVAVGVWFLVGAGWALCALGGLTIVGAGLMETRPAGTAAAQRPGAAARPPFAA